MTAMNWSSCSAFAFLVSSLLPAFVINAINLGQVVDGDERVQVENLDHEKSVG